MNLQIIQEQNTDTLIHLRENNGRLESIIDRLNYNLSSPGVKSSTSSDEKALSKGLIVDINDTTAAIKNAMNYNSNLLETLEIALYRYGQEEDCEIMEKSTSKQLLRG